jgi:hypothetical protein
VCRVQRAVTHPPRLVAGRDSDRTSHFCIPAFQQLLVLLESLIRLAALTPALLLALDLLMVRRMKLVTSKNCLILTKELLRSLTDVQLTRVAGGFTAMGLTAASVTRERQSSVSDTRAGIPPCFVRALVTLELHEVA